MRVMVGSDNETARDSYGSKVFPSLARIRVSNDDSPIHDVIVDITEVESHDGKTGLMISIVRGDPIWDLPVNPFTGGRPVYKTLLVDA